MNASHHDVSGYKSIRWHSFDSAQYEYQESANSLLKPNAKHEWWRQEFSAEFLTISNGFFFPDELDEIIDYDIPEFGSLHPTNAKTYWGIDWGASKDSTVIWIMEDVPNGLKTKYIKEIKNTEYDKQIDYIVNLSHTIKPTIIKADVGGRAQNTILANKYGLPIHPPIGVSMALQSKHELYHNAKYAIQSKQVVCPLNKKWYEQMVGITAERSMSGYLMFSDKAVGFDDYVDAFVLACSCKRPTGGYSTSYSIGKRTPRERDTIYKPKSRTRSRKQELEKERKRSKKNER